MRYENLLPETLKEWAEEARVPHNLADRVLQERPRPRWGTMTLAAATTVMVVVGGVLVPRLLPGAAPVAGPAAAASPSEVASVDPDPLQTAVAVPTGQPGESSAAPTPEMVAAPDSVQADTENSPPKKLIAAGRVAVSAYFIWKDEKIGDKKYRRHETWYLYKPATGTYEETDWAALDVAPGMKSAAVLERDLPAKRIGLLDMATHEVVKWVDVDHSVTDVSWSPDGTKVLATAYDRDPTIRTNVSADGSSSSSQDPGRTGFQIVDVASGRASFHPVPSRQKGEGGMMFPQNGRFAWSDDGSLLSGPDEIKGGSNKLYYDLEGRPHDAPATEVHPSGYERAEVSPDGKLYADSGNPPGPETVVKEVATGNVVGRQRMLQLLAWADDEHLIALGCAGKCDNEFNNGLVLVSVDGKTSVQLSGNRKNSQQPGSWAPLLTRR